MGKSGFTTDDLAFSAWLKMKGHNIITSHQNGSKTTFTFGIDPENAGLLKVEFINSTFLQFYNEIRNLKKVLNNRK